MAAKPTPAPRKASGENIEEWQRKTEQLKLRLPKDQAEQLRERATQEEMTPQEYLLRLLRRDLQIV